MTKPVSVDENSFDQVVLQSDKPVLADLWAAWCQPCLMIAPTLDELAEEYSDKIKFVKVDIDQNPKIAAKYGIMSIPALLLFKNGAPVNQIIGLRPKAELKRILDTVVE